MFAISYLCHFSFLFAQIPVLKCRDSIFNLLLDKALNELVSSIKKCGYFDQPQTEEEEEAIAEEEPDEAEDQGLAADGDAASTEVTSSFLYIVNHIASYST